MATEIRDVKNLKIAYIGGGSRGWARNLMNDLAKDGDLAGEIHLYDIDMEASKMNEKIGNTLSSREDIPGKWKYIAQEKIGDALTGADFVVISILPGTFDEMHSDVHSPEEYGIWQPVGDSTGPGGIVRALRTLPIFEGFAKEIEKYCPNAWVINFTNPMTTCVKALYKGFPGIKAFGCCHEVFGTQRLLANILKEKYGVTATREEIITNVIGVNHFTFLTEARYKDFDLFPMYREFINEHPQGLAHNIECNHWANAPYKTREMVKFDLFKRFNLIAAAGDRHLIEFCPSDWYLKNPEMVEAWGYNLTTVDWRKKDLEARLQKAKDNYEGKPFALYDSHEETVKQIKALLGLGDFVTNVNIPNIGQVPNNPLGAVVETNAFFSGDSVRPVIAGPVPEDLNKLIMHLISEHEDITEASLNGDYELAFQVFKRSQNVNLEENQARELFNKMLERTKEYLPFYDKYIGK